MPGANRSRNGRTGELLDQSLHPADTPKSQLSCRQRRAKLQAALLKEVDQSRIQLSKKLVDIEKLPSGRVVIRFEDGHTDEVDLLVAADGIRSVSNSLSGLNNRSAANKTGCPFLHIPLSQNQIQWTIRISHHHQQVGCESSRHHPRVLSVLAEPRRKIRLHESTW